MAKSRKSKILASMLAVSTMAVFYAAPVMAGTASVINTDDGIAISIESTGTITGGGQPNDGIYFDRAYDNNAGAVYGMLTISSEKIAEALKGQDVTFGAVTADTISNTKDSFIVDSDGNVKAATGSFERMTLNGSDIYAGGHVLKVGDQTLNFLLANRAIENTAGIERVDYGNGVGETTIEGATTFDQSGMGVYTSTGTSVVSGGQATFRDNSGGFTQIMGGDITASGSINVAGSSNIGGVGFDGGIVTAERMTLNGSDIYAGGHVLKVGDQTLNFLLANRAIENTAGIERVDYGNGVGETTIEGATTFDQSGMGVYTSTGTSVVSGGQATFTDKNGSFTQIMGGDITAETLNGKNIDDLVVGSDITNIGGINRVDSNEDGTLDTTIIENTLAVSENEVSAVTGDTGFIMNDNYLNLQHGFNTGITLSDNGIDLNGDVYFTGHDDKRYTLSDLEGRVYDLEQKTQNITSADPGQGGGSEVPPTGEGHTGFEGNVTVI